MKLATFSAAGRTGFGIVKGDGIEVEISGIGVLANPIVAES